MVDKTMVNVDINDKIRINVDGTVLIVHALDVVESVRQFQHLEQEVERLRSFISLVGTVLPDGSVEFRGDPLDNPDGE